MLEMEFKPNSTPQNRLVRWGLHHIYILWNCLISSRCETSNTLHSRRDIYISCVELEINGWSVSGPIAGGTKRARNLARIVFFFAQWLWYHVRSEV